MHGGAYYRTLRDIDDVREITTFEHILKKFGHPTLEIWKWKESYLDDAREISAFLTYYFKEHHTVVIGNKHQDHSTEPFFLYKYENVCLFVCLFVCLLTLKCYF